MGSLGSVADVLNGPMGLFVKSIVAAVMYNPVMFSVDLGWVPPPIEV